jgi:hypothetical protein
MGGTAEEVEFNDEESTNLSVQVTARLKEG